MREKNRRNTIKQKKPGKPQKDAVPSRSPAPAFSLAGLLLGFSILYFHLLAGVYERYFYTNVKIDMVDIPGLFEFFNRFTGIGLIVVSLAYLAYSFYCKEAVDSFLKKHYRTVILVLLAIVALIMLFACYHKFFNNDEFEHIHSSWYIKQGYLPYKDFYQHHNPLLWYFILPLLYLFGDSIDTILAVRMLMGVAVLGIAWLTYLITVAATKSKETGLVSVALLFSSALFMEKGIEIRPDVLQVFFGMISLYALFLFTEKGEHKYILISGLCAGISFLCLQKTVFLLAGYGIMVAYAWIRKQVRLKSIACFVAAFLLPLLIYAGYLFLSDSFHEYMFNNWKLNFVNMGTRKFSSKSIQPLKYTFSQNFLIWLIACFAVIFLFLKQKTPWQIKAVTFLGVFQIVSLFSYGVTFKHYYLFIIPLLCISGAYYLSSIFENRKLVETNRIAVLGLLLFSALSFHIIDIFNSNRLQLAKIDYYLKLTKESDLMYDGTNTVNVFRRDVHYFWYQLISLSTYNYLTHRKFGDYDIGGLIWAKRPKVISDFKLDMDKSGLKAIYAPTAYRHFYIRRDDAGTPGS